MPLKRIIFPASFFEGRAASWQDVLNMWGHSRSLVLPPNSLATYLFQDVATEV